MSDFEYWALDREQIASHVDSRVRSYHRHLQASGIAYLWYRSWRQMYKPFFQLGSLTTSGEQDEYLNLNVNHLHSLKNHLVTLTTAQKPAWDVKAINSDLKSLKQARLGSGLLEYYYEEKNLGAITHSAADISLQRGEAYATIEWDPNIGEVVDVDVDTGALEVEGDLVYKVHDPLYVARDVHKRSANPDDHNWYIVSEFVNKWDLAAKYTDQPEVAAAIQQHEFSPIEDEPYLDSSYFRMFGDDFPRDDILVHTLYHRPTPAVPKGLLVRTIGDAIELAYSELPYPVFPVFRMAPDSVHLTPWGHTSIFDIMPLQEALDGLNSVIMSNLSSFGAQSIWAPPGTNISLEEIASGMIFIESPQKPEPLQLTHSPKEAFDYRLAVASEMETLSGVNSVVRGNPEASLKTGAALALVQSTAVAYTMGHQRSYARFVEGIGTATLKILQWYADSERVATIIGRTNRPSLQAFTGDELQGVSRVSVTLGSALSKTISGRIQIAQDLLAHGKIATAEEYLTLITTGTIEPMYEDQQAELFLIREENEMLLDGVLPYAVFTDSHAQHIREHRSVLASKEARNNPQLVEMVSAHIDHHIELLKNTPPEKLMLTGQQPLMPPMPASADGSAAGVQGGKGMPPGLDSEQPNMPNMPNMPKNPATGEPAPNPGDFDV